MYDVLDGNQRVDNAFSIPVRVSASAGGIAARIFGGVGRLAWTGLA